MRPALVLGLLCALVGPASAGQPIAALRDKLTLQRKALVAHRDKIVEAPSTAKLYEARARLSWLISGGAGVGIARSTVGGKNQLRLVVSTNGGALGFGAAALAGTSHYSETSRYWASGPQPLIPLIERRDDGMHVTPLIGFEKHEDSDDARKGWYATVGLGGASLEGEHRINFLRMPLTPKWRSRALRKVDKALAHADQALHQLTLAEIHGDADAHAAADTLARKVDAYLEASK